MAREVFRTGDGRVVLGREYMRAFDLGKLLPESACAGDITSRRPLNAAIFRLPRSSGWFDDPSRGIVGRQPELALAARRGPATPITERLQIVAEVVRGPAVGHLEGDAQVRSCHRGSDLVNLRVPGPTARVADPDAGC